MRQTKALLSKSTVSPVRGDRHEAATQIDETAQNSSTCRVHVRGVGSNGSLRLSLRVASGRPRGRGGCTPLMATGRGRPGIHLPSVLLVPQPWPASERAALESLVSRSLCLVSRRAAPSAEFSVDRTRHLMSFLTMMGPSPDWNVGLSAEDLCTKECGWVQKVVQDLIPWDAGTDSGVTYEVGVRLEW